MPNSEVHNKEVGSASIEDHIAKIGFGWYQIHAYIFCCGFIIAEAAAITVSSGNVIAMSDYFDIPEGFGRSSLMTCTFTGFAIGTFISGPLSDYIGRQTTALIAYNGMVVAGSAIFLNDVRLLVYFDNAALGVFAGLGIPVAFIVMAELTPVHLRGICTAAAGFAFVIGELWAAFGLWCFNLDLQTGMWRQLVIWATIPSAVLMLVGLASGVARKETPQWIALNRGTKAASEVINLMARTNGASDRTCIDIDDAQSQAISSSGLWAQWSMLANQPYLLYTIVLASLFFVKDLIFYGSSVFWPLTWSQLNALEDLTPAAKLMITEACAIPGYGLAMIIMSRFPRRSAYCGACCIVAVASVCMISLRSAIYVGLVGGALLRLFFPTMKMITLLLPSEIFPVEIRGVGFSMAALCGRIATVAAPSIVHAAGHSFLISVSSVTAIGALLVFFLPETMMVGSWKACGGKMKCTGTSEFAPLHEQGQPDYTDLKA